MANKKTTYDSLMDGLLKMPYTVKAKKEKKLEALKKINTWIISQCYFGDFHPIETYSLGLRFKWSQIRTEEA